MTAIGPGDFVEAIRTPRPEDVAPGGVVVRAGGLYCVAVLDSRDTEPCDHCGNTEPGFYLVGDAVSDEWVRCPCNYKPIDPHSGSLIHRLLQPIDETTPEQVPA